MLNLKTVLRAKRTTRKYENMPDKESSTWLQQSKNGIQFSILGQNYNN